MPALWLEAPHFRQTTEGACLEACVCMVLAYWQSPVLESTVSKLFEAGELGTPASRVLRLEKWGFKVTYGSASLPELRAWLEKGIPPITFVKTQFLDYWIVPTPHAVVVVGINDDKIYLNDPAFDSAPQISSLNGFLAAWVEMNEMVAVITQ